MEFKDKLFNLRKENHLSQQQLADQLNVSRQSISKWETGESQPDVNNIIILSEIFSVTTDYLLKEDENNEEKEKRTPIFLVIGSIMNLLGAIVGYMLNRYYYNSLSLMCGMIIQIMGCILFEYYALKEKDEKAQKTFFSFNIWLLCFLPIQYFAQTSMTYQWIENYLWNLDIGRTIIGYIFIAYFPLVIALVLGSILFILIRKIF